MKNFGIDYINVAFCHHSVMLVETFDKYSQLIIYRHCVKMCPNKELFLFHIFPYSD